MRPESGVGVNRDLVWKWSTLRPPAGLLAGFYGRLYMLPCVFICLCSEGSRREFCKLFLGRAWRSRGQAARLAEHVVVLVPVEKVIDGPELGDLFRVVYR